MPRGFTIFAVKEILYHQLGVSRARCGVWIIITTRTAMNPCVVGLLKWRRRKTITKGKASVLLVVNGSFSTTSAAPIQSCFISIKFAKKNDKRRSAGREWNIGAGWNHYSQKLSLFSSSCEITQQCFPCCNYTTLLLFWWMPIRLTFLHGWLQGKEQKTTD